MDTIRQRTKAIIENAQQKSNRNKPCRFDERVYCRPNLGSVDNISGGKAYYPYTFLVKMNIPKQSSSFGLGNILGLIFVLIGIVLVLALSGYNLPVDLGNAKTALEYGAAIGSILGGLSMLFKKKETVPQIRIK